MSDKTEFVTTNGKVAIQSYQPCHLFGASDIYGRGVRYGFYFQYGAAILALWFKFPGDIAMTRYGLTLIALALFISLCLNSTSDKDVVILDWVLAYQLVLFIPFYALWPTLYSRYVYRGAKDFKWILKVLRFGGGSAGARQDYEKALMDSYIASLTREFELAALIRSAEEVSGDVYRQAFDNYNTAAAHFLVQATSGSHLHGTLALFHAGRLSENMTALGAIQDIFFERLEEVYRKEGDSQQHASTRAQRALDQARLIAEYEAREKPMKSIRKYHKKIYRHEIVSLGVILLIWTAYMCATPWMFFKASRHGQKQGCDIKLRILDFFVPISIYNNGYLIWLKIYACISVIVAAVFLYFALYFIGYGVLYRCMCFPKQRRPPKPEEPVQSDEEAKLKAKIPELSKEDILQAAIRDYKTVQKIQNWFYRGCGVSLCSALLVGTVVTVQLTIKSNNIDLSAASFSSTSQLLPFLIALFTFASVLFHVAVEIVTTKITAKDIVPGNRMKDFFGDWWSKWTGGDKPETGAEGVAPEAGPSSATPEGRAEEGRAGPSNTARPRQG